MTESLLAGLNQGQRDAVTAPDGPTLVLAGAGSGKTRVIVHRMAFLVRERGVAADTILAVTFTNKAADEMRTRVGQLVTADARGMAVHTFHALGLRLLRRFAEDAGLRPGFTVYGNDDRKALLRRICRETGIAEQEFPLARIGQAVSAIKLESFEPGDDPSGRFEQIAAQVATRYQRVLEDQSAVDFDDLLLRAVTLLECSTRAQAFVERRFQHVLVDEYQDTNRIQYRLLRLLAPHKNVFVVGDEDQSIYNFRGADMRNILDFESDFAGATVVKLEVNYRSTDAILRAASAVIQNNADRKGKSLVAHTDGGDPPELHGADDDRAEAAHIAERLLAFRRESNTADAAILVRTHSQTRVLEEEMVARGIPHRVLGGLRFYDRKEIRDALAYARLAANPDDDASFRRVVNVPARGIGPASLAVIEQAAATGESSLWGALDDVLSGELISGRARLGLMRFRELVSGLIADREKQRPSALLRRILDTSGLEKELDRDPAAARERRENLDQLVAAALEVEAEAESNGSGSLQEFLDGVSLLSDVDTVGPTPCLLMTLHAAKGLEFDTVFMAGLEEGLFPHVRASGNRKSLEEERRLFYVGMTRAKRKLFLSFALSRRFSHQASSRRPSRFLAEIPNAVHSGAGRSRSEAPAPSVSALRPGVFVHHAKFGEGKVVDASGRGPDRKVTVQFRNAGRKRLVAKFAKLQVVG